MQPTLSHSQPTHNEWLIQIRAIEFASHLPEQAGISRDNQNTCSVRDEMWIASIPRLMNNTAFRFLKSTQPFCYTYTEQKTDLMTGWKPADILTDMCWLFYNSDDTGSRQQNKTFNHSRFPDGRPRHLLIHDTTWLDTYSLEKFHHFLMVWSESELNAINLCMSTHNAESRHSTVRSLEMLLSMVLKRLFQCDMVYKQLCN